MTQHRILQLCRIYLSQAWSRGYGAGFTAGRGGEAPNIDHHEDVERLLEQLAKQIEMAGKRSNI